MELSKTKLVVIEFEATWCSACRSIGPLVEGLSSDRDIEFSKVDVDQAPELANGIQAMPTFQFFRNGNKVNELIGANFDKLKSMITQFK